MSLRFTVVETTTSPLWDFGWFDLTRFKLDGPLTERQSFGKVLTAFVRDPIFHRSFCTSIDPWGNAGGLHGPFLLTKFVPEWYRPFPHNEIQLRVAMLLDNPEFTSPPSGQQRAPVEAWLKSSRTRGDELVALVSPDIPGVVVEFNIWLLFNEFVCLTPDREEMIVAVIGYD